MTRLVRVSLVVLLCSILIHSTCAADNAATIFSKNDQLQVQQNLNLPAVLFMQRYTLQPKYVHPISSSATTSSMNTIQPLCNDGSVATYYYRNCSANWDRKAGDPDFCQKGIIDGVKQHIFTIDFLSSSLTNITTTAMTTTSTTTSTSNHANQYQDSNAYQAGWCNSDQQCQQRQALDINLTSSVQYPDTLFIHSGILSIYAEQNPNFYKSIHVVVPYCSSDAWLGNRNDMINTMDNTQSSPAFTFQGSHIVKAVILELIQTKQLLQADSIVIIGNIGIMIQIAEIMDLLVYHYQQSHHRTNDDSITATIKLYLVCDGCVLLDMAPFLAVKPFGIDVTLTSTIPGNQNEHRNQPVESSTVDPQSPLVQSLATGLSYWNTSLSPKLNCADAVTSPWKCLLAPSLIEYITSFSDLISGIFIQQALADSFQLSALNAWPPTIDNEPYIESFIQTYQAYLHSLAPPASDDTNVARMSTAITPFIFAYTCPAPSTCALDNFCTYHTQVPYIRNKISYNATSILEYGVMINDANSTAVIAIDACSYLGCNPTCLSI